MKAIFFYMVLFGETKPFDVKILESSQGNIVELNCKTSDWYVFIMLTYYLYLDNAN